MPKLPSLEGTTVSPLRTQAPRVNVSVTPEQIAGPEVRLLTELGKKADEVTAFVVRKQNAHDLAVVTQAESAMQEILMERKLAANELRGTQTKDLLKNGEQFFDGNLTAVDGEVITPEHRQTISRYQDIYEGLDARQQGAVDQLRQKKRLSFLTALGTHEQAETDKAAIAGSTAAIVTAQAAAYANPYDEGQRKESIENIIAKSQAIARINGEQTESTTKRSALAISSIHENAIKTFIARGDVATATEYLRTHRKEIMGDVSGLQKKIATRTSNGKALQIATEAVNAEDPMAYVVKQSKGDPDVFQSAMSNLSTFQSQKKKQDDNAQIEARDTLYDHLVKNEGRVDFENLNGEAPWGDNSLQAKYDSLPLETKEKLTAVKDGLLGKKTVVPERVDLVTYEHLSSLQYLMPDEFKKINFGLSYYGRLTPGNIKHFSDIQAKMHNNEMKETKDQLGEYFEHAGWVGADNAPRRGSVRIEVRQAITKYEDDNDGRSPDDAWITKTIEGKMGNAAYLKGVEKKYPIAPTVPKPMAGMTSTNRINTRLAMAGITKNDHAQAHATAVDAFDREVETYKSGHQGQIPEHVEINIARRIANDEVYQESGHWWTSDSAKLQTVWDQDPKADKSIQYVKVGEDERRVYIKDLQALSTNDKKAVMREIARTGSDDSSKSIAETWIRLNPGKEIGKSDIITNPSGGAVTTNQALLKMAEGQTPAEMQEAASSIGAKYGANAKFNWTMISTKRMQAELNRTRGN